MLSDRLRSSLLKRSLKTKLAFGLKENLALGGLFGGFHGASVFDPQKHRGKSRTVSAGLGALGGAGAAALTEPLVRAAFKRGMPTIPVVLGAGALEYFGSGLPAAMYLKSKPKQTYGGLR